MDSFTIGVFSGDEALRTSFLHAVAKKSEAEGLSVHLRTGGGARYSFLEPVDFPERIQTSAKIASFADHAYFLFPMSGKLSAPDGELAVLASSYHLPGSLAVFDQGASLPTVLGHYKGTAVERYQGEIRQRDSAAIDLSAIRARADLPKEGTLVSIDRAFTVKGVGTVVLGFVLAGEVKVHQQLRLVPGQAGLKADVKGIQVNDVDAESAGRGIRVGLSLRGVEPSQLDRTNWLDDGSYAVSQSMQVDYEQSPFYKQEVDSRELHVQLPGAILPGKLVRAGGSTTVQVVSEFPQWPGMRFALVDLNGRGLRVAGGGTIKV